MTAVSSLLTSAQIALKLLGAGPAAAQAMQTKADLSRALQGSGTKITLTAQTAQAYFGAGSDVARVAALGDHVEITTSGLEVPQDKAAFRKQVLDFLKSDAAGHDARYADQAAFIQALKDGKVTVQSVDEVPEFNWQPDVGWTIWRDGYAQGGGITSQPVGNQALYDHLDATRGQNIGQIDGHMFYAWFQK